MPKDTHFDRQLKRLGEALREGELPYILEDEDANGVRVRIETPIPDAKITVLVHSMGGVAEYFVSYHHKVGDFSCMSGTTSLTQALMDLGSARTCAGNTHMRLEDERRAKIHA